jgi:thioredoxin 1
MTIQLDYSIFEPTRAAVDALKGPTVVEFGTAWCGYCRAAQPLIARAFEHHRGMRHLKIEDGKGRPLGRSFQVKLWPTLIFLSDGAEIERLVRPQDSDSIRAALNRIAAR